MRLAESRDVGPLDAPIQRFAENMKRECARAALAMGKNGAVRFRHFLLEGADIGFGDGRAADRDEAIFHACRAGGAFFLHIAWLTGLFTIRPGIDDAFIALGGERLEIGDHRLARNGQTLVDLHGIHRHLLL
ncbi:hypothetical protein D3C72_2002740 [compost metagenome]